MAWSDYLIPMVREMIGDTATPYENDDISLQRKILTAINLMQIEITFDIDYTADIVGLTLIPDPSTSSPMDKDFISLAALKTACLMERSDVTKLTGLDVKFIQDNDFTIKTGEVGKDKIDALKINWCVAYNNAKADFILGRNANLYGKAVISPFPYRGDGLTGYRIGERRI